MSGYSPVDERELERLAVAYGQPEIRVVGIEGDEYLLADLPSVAEDLRHVPPPRTGWGHWRSVAHDFVYEVLEL